MARREVELVQFAASLAECPGDDLPEIAMSGRSNVGKSSLINLLTGKKRLAYTSREPGKTRVLTYYEVDQAFRLVDTQGYGFAKVGDNERKRWKRLADNYFRSRSQLRGVIQLIDLKVGPTAADRGRVEHLTNSRIPLCIALTKADKVPRNRRQAAVAEHLSQLILAPETGVVMTSSLEKQGHKELWAWIDDTVRKPRV